MESSLKVELDAFRHYRELLVEPRMSAVRLER